MWLLPHKAAQPLGHIVSEEVAVLVLEYIKP